MNKSTCSAPTLDVTVRDMILSTLKSDVDVQQAQISQVKNGANLSFGQISAKSASGSSRVQCVQLAAANKVSFNETDAFFNSTSIATSDDDDYDVGNDAEDNVKTDVKNDVKDDFVDAVNVEVKDDEKKILKSSKVSSLLMKALF